MSIRFANTGDRERIIEIYNQAVETGVSTADLSPATVESRSGWFATHTEESYPIYVEEMGTDLTGWCSLSPYRPGRMALRYTAEISYYVSHEYQRQGVASRLIQHAITDCPRLDSNHSSEFYWIQTKSANDYLENLVLKDGAICRMLQILMAKSAATYTWENGLVE